MLKLAAVPAKSMHCYDSEQCICGLKPVNLHLRYEESRLAELCKRGNFVLCDIEPYPSMVPLYAVLCVSFRAMLLLSPSMLFNPTREYAVLSNAVRHACKGIKDVISSMQVMG